MAIKLTDIVTVMKDKWTYGDKFFGYTEEFNDNHNTQYPSLLITPPTSIFPEVGLNNGWENYTFEIYFSDLYNRTAQANEAIDQRWENLQDLATEWLDNFLKYYQATAPILAFLEDESVTIERNKEVANDQLLQIKMTFSWRVLSKCFRPQSTSPNEIANLAVWLRADSGVTFSTPTKKVSAWEDSSGNGNNVAQTDKTKQPLRYSYNGASDKTQLSFSGTDEFESLSNSPINKDFAIFTVAKANPVTPPFTNDYSVKFDPSITGFCNIGNPAPNVFSFTDGAGNDEPFSVSVWSNGNPLEPWRMWVNKYSGGSDHEYIFEGHFSSGYIKFRLFDGTGGEIWARVTTYAAAQLGEWHNYTATYDGSNLNSGLKIYIDGVESQDSTGGTYSGMPATTADLEIGSNLNGFLDEVSFYTKQLSGTEVIEIYNLGNAPDLTTLTSSNANLLSWWRMGDGATFPTIPDASGNGYDGTLDGSMTASDITDFPPNSEESAYFTYELGNVKICLGSSSERLYCHIADDAQGYGEWNARNIWNGDTSKYHLCTMKLDSTTANLSLQYNNTTPQEGTMSGYNAAQTYNGAKFKIGNGTHLGNLDGSVQELIIYNRTLASSEVAQIQDYLNKKYKIY